MSAIRSGTSLGSAEAIEPHDARSAARRQSARVRVEAMLDDALAASFPSSDPISLQSPADALGRAGA